MFISNSKSTINKLSTHSTAARKGGSSMVKPLSQPVALGIDLTPQHDNITKPQS